MFFSPQWSLLLGNVRSAAVRASIHQGSLWNWNCQLCGVSCRSISSYFGRMEGSWHDSKLLKGCSGPLDSNRWKYPIYVLVGTIIKNGINRQLGKVSMVFVEPHKSTSSLKETESTGIWDGTGVIFSRISVQKLLKKISCQDMGENVLLQDNIGWRGRL